MMVFYPKDPPKAAKAKIKALRKDNASLKVDIRLMKAQVKTRELQIAKMASVEQIRKLEAAVQRENVCSHYRPDCPVHREIN